jgi:hypothetical protein
MALISTLQDNFNDNSIDTAKWYTGISGGSITETNNELQFTTATGGTESTFDTLDPTLYDFTGSRVSIKLVDAGIVANLSSYFILPLTLFTGDWAHQLNWFIIKSGGNWYIRTNYDATNYTSNIYNSTDYRYISIEETGGTTYWKKSPNGINWTTEYSIANPMVVTSVRFQIKFYSTAEATTTTAKVDDFNILPQTTYFVCSTTGAPGDTLDLYVNDIKISTWTST